MINHQHRMASVSALLLPFVAFVAGRKSLAGLLLAAGLLVLSPVSQAQTFTGDFNGDGLAGDVATINNNLVTIRHQGGAPTSYHIIFTSTQFGNRLFSVSELNGRPGVEISVIYDTAIQVIDDRRKTVRTNSIWSIGLFGPRVVTFRNWDGIAGNEIIFNYYTWPTSPKIIYIDRTNRLVFP
jgi:hypothetical protein